MIIFFYLFWNDLIIFYDNKDMQSNLKQKSLEFVLYKNNDKNNKQNNQLS